MAKKPKPDYGMGMYVLDINHKPIATPSVIQWAMFFEKTSNRIVRQEQVGPIWVSTIFMGIDHSFGMGGPPILFETMTFDSTEEDRAVPITMQRLREDGGWNEQEQLRCSTWNQAIKQHEKVVARINEAITLATGALS